MRDINTIDTYSDPPIMRYYSNKSRGLREKQGNLTPDDQPLDETDEAIEIIDVSEYQPRRTPSKQWRECIKKIYETDPLCCPNCGGEIHPIRYCAVTDRLTDKKNGSFYGNLMLDICYLTG